MGNSNVYVGVDLHKRKATYVKMNCGGKVLETGSLGTSLDEVRDFSSRLTARHHVVLEPVENCYWFIDQVAAYAGSVRLAHPYKVRLIAASRLKNDRIDAGILADLLRVGYLPEVYVPQPEVQVWRKLISHHIRLVRDRVRLKNRIHGILNREGCRLTVKNPFSKTGRAELDSMETSLACRQTLDDHLVNHDLLAGQIDAIDREIKEIADQDRVCQLLVGIDGVGSFTALAIRAAVGEIERFPSPKAFAAYTGLIPSYRHSADKIRNGPITKQGSSTLRWVLIQAVPHVRRHSDYLQKMYYRISLRSSTQKAKVAVAHALARIIYHVWKENRAYYP